MAIGTGTSHLNDALAQGRVFIDTSFGTSRYVLRSTLEILGLQGEEEAVDKYLSRHVN